MKHNKFLLLGISALLIFAFLGAAHWYRSNEAKRIESLAKANAEPLVRSYNPVLGPVDARVTIVEFVDPECESCREFFHVVKQVMSEFHGRVRLVVRYMPFHSNSAYTVGILEAARKQGKYWEALDMLFARQPEWASHHNPKPELIMGYMKELGLDIEQLKRSIKDSEHQRRLKQDEYDGIQLGVTSTPTLFINGKFLEKLGYEELRSAIDTEQRK